MGAVAIVLALVFALSQAPVGVAGVNTADHATFLTITHRTEACQVGEVLPGEVSAVRLRMYAFLGPRVTVSLSAGARQIAYGERASGWTGAVVTVPVGTLAGPTAGVELCFAVYLDGEESVKLSGQPGAVGARAAVSASGPLPGRLRVEYLRAGSTSWWSLALQVARRMGLGHAPSGTWGALLVVVLMGGVALVCARAVLRGLA